MTPEVHTKRILLNDGWSFAKESPQGFAPVEIPHDWLIADPENLYQSGVGYYRRILDTSFLQAGQRLYLYFDGVYMDSSVSVNGRLAGEWKNGCTPFYFDITELITTEKPNKLLVKVNYQAPNARWYTGAGIYRDVFLIVKNACHFAPNGIAVTTYRENGQWRFRTRAEVIAPDGEYTQRHTLVEPDDTIAAWEPGNPKLYTLRSELIAGGTVTDTVYTRFGFRSLRFTSDEGFWINDKPLKLKGVCLHGDLGSLGGAVHKDALRRQLLLMRRMGANAIRTAHNPPAEALLELTDELGLLVMSEITDVWRNAKTTYDYARFFDEWIERDIAAWVRRDRCHPSVILWSIGNEIHDTHLDAETGASTTRHLMELVRRHDPDGHAPCTLCSNYMWWGNTHQSADVIKLIGYNYSEILYKEHHAAHPDWVIYGGETASTVQSRGIYHFPLAQPLLSDDDLQCSSLGNSLTSWGTRDLEGMILDDLQTRFSLGQFVWSGLDYLGEPTPYQTKNAYFGMTDTAGFEKDAYYLFQAGWTDFDAQPVLHLFPYWDFSPGELIDVRVCTNAPEAELFVNGESLGRHALRGRLLSDWQVPYRAGVLKAVAYDRDGLPVKTAERRSFGEAAELVLAEEGIGDLRFINITARDAQGNPVENANRRVRVSVQNGRLLALDNGDSTDFEPYQNTNSKRMFSGKLLAIVKAGAGETPVVSAVFDETDIPIRKVELKRDGDLVTAKILPENATYQDLVWRIANAAGIDSLTAALLVHPGNRQATITEKGDGIAYVRCMPKNGRQHPAFISMLKVEVTGHGAVKLDPYTFISAGLYTLSNEPMDNGNERGISTLRTGESHVGFANLDFGAFGADTFELPLFVMENEPLPFAIWEGMPQEGGRKLADYVYDLGSQWAVYQTAVYTLPRRLQGITTLCFVFPRKIHFKGFRFRKLNKAYETLGAAQCDAIYGDAYQINGGAVEGIGNNVTIEYRDMDFGTVGTQRLSVRWRSKLLKNAIQIVFSGGTDTTRLMIEVDAAETYREQAFPLGRKILGKQTVSFIFLPGSSLDLASIRFLQD
ncbi:MAG TPA: glycoside hydrolase family 2 TIM barrel-domain containing protein [Candidatus Limiplasma sp.]|nr:glycoside hydrolase family 2 TIM barrel-domain containing protein [Candidatus Limiplasma sp.]